MTPIINPWLFYLIDLITNLKLAFFVAPLLFLAFLVIYLGVTVDDGETINAKWIKTFIIFTTVSLTLAFLLPSKKTCYQMMAASQVTEENIKSAEEVIKDSVDYIFEKINK